MRWLWCLLGRHDFGDWSDALVWWGAGDGMQIVRGQVRYCGCGASETKP